MPLQPEVGLLLLYTTPSKDIAVLRMQVEEQSPLDGWDFQADQMLSFR